MRRVRGRNGRTAVLRQALARRVAFPPARIDGKSPVEYITSERDKAFVRALAKTFLNGSKTLDEMLAHWTQALAARQMLR